MVAVELPDAVGRVLAEEIAVDRDLPPFDRVSMDGIAFAYRDWTSGCRTFRVQGSQAAGVPRQALTQQETCLEVMTGAVLPEGCDVVVRYEDITVRDGEAVVNVDAVQPWQNVHRQGVDARQGQVVLQPPARLGPAEIALLASVGKSRVHVLRNPRFALVSTGDELVDVDEIPEPWQIRRSNTFALQAALRELGVEAHCFHLRDDAAEIRSGLERLLAEWDVIVVSGGVSKGKYDYVPDSLEAVGFRKLFHQVSQRPGKPFWFGASSGGKVCFALPGNPVSTFMCFYRYVKPWLLKSMGISAPTADAVLAKDFVFAPPLTYFLQVAVTQEGGTLKAHPRPGGGSGDFANLREVHGFLELPLERSEFKAGEVFPLIGFRE